MKKVTLEEQEINLSQLIKDIDNDMLKKECKYSINAIVTGYCDRKLDKHQLSWIDLYGKIEMRHPSDDKPFLTCTRKKTESHYSFWEECNSIKFYLRNYRSMYKEQNYCACEIDGRMCESEGGTYYLYNGSIKAYSIPNDEAISSDPYMSWQTNQTETNYETTAWYPNGQTKYHIIGFVKYNQINNDGNTIGKYIQYKEKDKEYYYLCDGKPSNKFEVLFKEQQQRGYKYLEFNNDDIYFIMYPSDENANFGRAAIFQVKYDRYRINGYSLQGHWKYQVLNNYKVLLENTTGNRKYLFFHGDLKNDKLSLGYPWHDLKFNRINSRDFIIKDLRRLGKL